MTSDLSPSVNYFVVGIWLDLNVLKAAVISGPIPVVYYVTPYLITQP